MAMDCEAARELLDAWALDALDDEDARAIEAHLAGCDACAGAAYESREGAASLALAVPLHAAGSALKARIVASAAVLTEYARPRRSTRWWSAAAAVMMLAVGGLSWGAVLQVRVNDLHDKNAWVGAQATAQSNDLATVRTEIHQADTERGQLVSALDSQNAVLDVVSQPDVTRTQLSGSAVAPQATGRYMWSPAESTGVFIATNLPPAPEGQAYELWIVYEGAWVSGGNFFVDSQGRGRLVVRRIEREVDHGPLLGFAVTLEPVVGVSEHSGATVMSSEAR